MNPHEQLLARVNALNHIVLHLMANEVSREENPYEAAGMLQMRMLMAAQVKIRKTKDKKTRERVSQMTAELNAIYGELFRYFEDQAAFSELETD